MTKDVIILQMTLLRCTTTAVHLKPPIHMPNDMISGVRGAQRQQALSCRPVRFT